MKRKLKIAQQRTRRLRKQLDTFQDVIAELKKKNLLTNQAAEEIEASFSSEASSLIKRQLNKSQKKLSVNTYPEELRRFALTLQFYSGRAYNYVRKIFGESLPHPQTLSKWYGCIDGKPGFSNTVLDALRIKSEGSGRITCSLMMDEIAIRKQVDYDGNKYIGYVDMGGGIEDSSALPVAREALVFLIVSLTEYWKVPVGYFLIDGLAGQERANLVNLCISNLYQNGADVVSLTFDGCSANCSMVTILGGSLNPRNQICSFVHPINPTQQICIFLDACHMLKLMRNLLADKGVLVDKDGNEIKWQFIKSLHEVQNKEGLRAGNRLHSRHIEWTRQKMKVKLAAQTLSSSVADAIEFCNEELKLPEFQKSEATVKFIRIVDRLFDLLNSRNPMAKGYKAPLRISNEMFWRPFIGIYLILIQINWVHYGCNFLKV